MSKTNIPESSVISIDTAVTQIDEAINEQKFTDWHFKQEEKRNEEEGYGDTRNDPTHMPDDNKHSPSQSLNCHRMSYYKANNAPREDTLPYGIFKFGHDFEEYIEQFLQESLSGNNLNVDNVIEVDYTTNGMNIAGTTDPVIFNSNDIPVGLFEVKTTKDTHFVRNKGVKERHLAQAHAYAKGLEIKYDLPSPPTMFFIYGGREDLDVVFFKREFDTKFWTETVLPWMEEDTELRQQDELPPTVDESKDYMCGYCDYAERCGNYSPSSKSPNTEEYINNVDKYWWDETIATEFQNTVNDMPPKGLLPLKVYPEDVVIGHLASYPDVPLTPTLAVEYPELVAGNGVKLPPRIEDVYGVTPQREVADWFCEKCMQSFDFDRFDWDGDFDELPTCPDCPDDPPLRGPKPTELLFVE